MNLPYDLHIHSCLSPCCDDDMTPCNIVNMSELKELKIIAVSDHNTVGNIGAVMTAAKGKDLLVVPAMELCTSEEIHLLCLFPSLPAAESFEAFVLSAGPLVLNRPDIFGNQWKMDAEDIVLGTEKRMLIAAANMDMSEALSLLQGLGGMAIPAHIDRDAYAMGATLGTIPKEYGFHTVEISRQATVEQVLQQYPEIAQMNLLFNSDAHHLWDISEPEHFIEVEVCSIPALFASLQRDIKI